MYVMPCHPLNGRIIQWLIKLSDIQCAHSTSDTTYCTVQSSWIQFSVIWVFIHCWFCILSVFFCFLFPWLPELKAQHLNWVDCNFLTNDIKWIDDGQTDNVQGTCHLGLLQSLFIQALVARFAAHSSTQVLAKSSCQIYWFAPVLIWLPHWCEMLAAMLMVRKGKSNWQGRSAKHQGPCVIHTLRHATPCCWAPQKTAVSDSLY